MECMEGQWVRGRRQMEGMLSERGCNSLKYKAKALGVTSRLF